jgi:lipopolysaccharide transport system ATP-binding protein
MSSITAVKCGLALPVYGAGGRSLKKIILSTATGGRIASDSNSVTVVQALRDISFEFNDGDRIALVGHNGAGKTSLLRMVAGVYEPTSGILRVEGRVTSLLDVTLGMDHEATGYENIVLRGLILGASKKRMIELTPSIAKFSELGSYLAMPVRTYSSGMVLRLAFSIVTSLESDILVMDEWLSVGDAGFIDKAEQRMRTVVSKSKILVLASHSDKIVRDLCNVVIRLEQGMIKDVQRQDKTWSTGYEFLI